MSSSNFPIYTEPAECRDCYKCLRECPVKAIKITDNKASIISEECIACGHCVEICPAGAKKVRNDLPRCTQLLKHGNKAVLSIAPSWKNYFSEPEDQFAARVKALGFTAVSETAEGADIFSRDCAAFMNSNKQPGISAACPTATAYIQKKYPETAKYIIPVASPAMLHSRVLKQRHGNDTYVIFAGPCFSKKLESDANPENIYAALTFEELEKWLESSPADAHDTANEAKIEKGGLGAFFPIDGGICKNVRSFDNSIETMGFSGIETIPQLCSNCGIKEMDPYFIEISACTGSCINGPSLRKKGNLLNRLAKIKKESRERELISHKSFREHLNVPEFLKAEPETKHNFKEIKEVLRSVGKYNIDDEKNCGGCGYETCRQFAEAVLENKAEKQMCLTYLRQISEKKADALLKTMPSAVVIADFAGHIIECNSAFARLSGKDTEINFESCPGLHGVELKRVIPFADDFFAVLESGNNITNRTWKMNNRIIEGSIFIIEKNNLAGAIFQDITTPSVNRDRIIRQAQTVLEKNVQTVQQIAFLLGENASETEVILNSIVESFSTDNGAEK